MKPSTFNTIVRCAVLSLLFMPTNKFETKTVSRTIYRSKTTLHYVVDEQKYDKLPILFARVDQDFRSRGVKYQRRGKKYVTPLEFEKRPGMDRYESNPNEINVTFVPLSRWEYSMRKMLSESCDLYVRMIPNLRHEDLDDILAYLFRYPIHVVIFIQCVGVIQSLLSALAFKNDVTFFKGRDTYDGISLGTVSTSCVQSWIILLYLYEDTNVTTSRVLLFQLAIHACISTWKTIRVRELRLCFTFLCVPWFNEKNSDTTTSASRSIDRESMQNLLYYVFTPLMISWTAHSFYNYDFTSGRHTVWNFILSSAADFCYLFGFLNMLPQLLLNYRLKSVSAMPWRVMTYKFFNTVIDDVFAFFIVQTTSKHRWMTLRDDVVFVLFLGQRWMYPVDRKRADEYGYVYDDSGDDKKEKMKVE